MRLYAPHLELSPENGRPPALHVDPASVTPRHASEKLVHPRMHLARFETTVVPGEVRGDIHLVLMR